MVYELFKSYHYLSNTSMSAVKEHRISNRETTL